MKHSYIVTATFLLLIGGISVGSLIAKDREFSPNENRYLSGVPKFSIAKVMSGEFQDDLEKYLNDQIIGRDQWITVKTAIQKSTGDTDIGGAYVGKNGYDFEKIIPEDVDEKLVNRNIKSVCDFFEQAKENLAKSAIASSAEKEKGIVADDRTQHISFLLVPTSGLVMQEKLPKNAILFDQEKYIDKVQKAVGDESFIDVRGILQEHADEEIYYRTDHHWTTYGAYLATKEWNRQIQDEKTAISQDIFVEVADDFRGSLYSKILDYDSAYDKIYRMRMLSDVEETDRLEQDEVITDTQYQVIADGKDIGGFYQEKMLEEKDKYAYFFGGNYGEVAITRIPDKAAGNSKQELENQQPATGNLQQEPEKQPANLLVIKDSFANAFVPLIADQYEHIYMVDLRYFNNSVQDYMKEKQITDVLVLYNISNFVTDKNLFKLASK